MESGHLHSARIGGAGGWGAVRRIGKRKIKDVDTQEDTFKAVLVSL